MRKYQWSLHARIPRLRQISKSLLRGGSGTMKALSFGVLICCAVICASPAIAGPPSAEDVDKTIVKAKEIARGGEFYAAMKLCKDVLEQRPDRESELKLKDTIDVLQRTLDARTRTYQQRQQVDRQNVQMNQIQPPIKRRT
jgi:hypothetical protein